MVIVYHEDLLRHEHWPDHPESPFRLKTLRKKFEQEGLWNDVVGPEMVSEDTILKIHGQEYIDRLKAGGNIPLDPDTMLRDDTYGFALLSASVAATAAKYALSGKPSIALSRPPGHHAGKCRAGGFCYLNNAAIAAASAGVRTAIVDLDVHHCNGTEEIFYDKSDVLVISLHEADFYWDSGYLEDQGEFGGEGYNVNIPIPAGSGNKTYEQAVDEIVTPILREFKPELIIVCLGIDAHYCDPNAHMLLNTQGYIELCRKLADEAKDGKIMFLMEGGYHLRATAEVFAGVAGIFVGKEIKPEYGDDKGEQSNGKKELRKIKEFLAHTHDLEPR
jgi:Deacetylases, including yeast histone deacetylase and acetoin utilization protein